MTRMALAGCLALAALGAVAVLDGGSATADAAPKVSAFAGNWSGTWSIAERGVAGTLEWTISNAGMIQGTLHDTTLESGGTVTGHVGTDGKIMMVGYAPNDAPASGFNGFSFQGTAVIDDGGTLVASLTGLGEGQATRPSLVALLERS